MTSKIIKKLIVVACFLCCTPTWLHAQQDGFGWRVGGSIGYMGYHGDLSSNNLLKEVTTQFKPTKDRPITWGVSVERKISRSIGLCVNYAQGSFTTNDRDRDESDPFYARSLNAQTKLRDLNGSFIFRSERRFFITPYLMLGGGLTNFSVYGDLKDANGNFYNYNTTVTQDGNFETQLDGLKTEVESYSTLVPHINAGIGLRFRLASWLSLHLQTDLRYAFSDHLEDVANNNFRYSADNANQAFAIKPNAAYTGTRANNTNDMALLNNDMYAYTSLGLRFSFGRRRADFHPPVFYAGNELPKVETIKVVPTEIPVGNSFVTLYDTLRMSSKNYQMTVDSSMAQQTKILLDSLNAIKLNNTQVQQQIAQSRADYELLQRDIINLKEVQTEEQRKATESRINELNNQVKYLSIATANNVKPADSTSVDAKYLLELQKMRTEIAAFKTDQAEKDRLAALKAQDANMPAPTTLPIATDASSLYYQRDMQAIRDQIAALNNNLASQGKQPIVLQQTAPTTNGNSAAESQAMMNTMQALSMQLNSISTRLSAVEGRPAQTNTAPIISNVPAPQQNNNQANEQLQQQIRDLQNQLSNLNNKPAPQQQPVIINTPAPQQNNNQANEQLQQQIRDLQNQLNNLNNKPAPQQQPVIINTPAPQPQQNNNQELLNQIKALQDQVKDLSNKPAPQQQPVIINTPAPQRVIVQQAAPQITYQQAIAPMRNTSIYFDNNSTVIKQSELAKLEKMANVLNTYPEAKITISGYTDSVGGDEYNRKLSERRANAVRDRLIQAYGIQASKVVLNAYGKSVTTSTASSALDRRVDIIWAD